MVDSWYCILMNNSKEECIATCLKVIGAFVAWIDIGLIANNRYSFFEWFYQIIEFICSTEQAAVYGTRFMELMFGYLGKEHSEATREEACECLKEISLKGMLPLDKLALVEKLWEALRSCNILTLIDDVRFSYILMHKLFFCSLICDLYLTK